MLGNSAGQPGVAGALCMLDWPLVRPAAQQMTALSNLRNEHRSRVRPGRLPAVTNYSLMTHDKLTVSAH